MLYICILTMHIRCFQNERSAPPLFYVTICGEVCKYSADCTCSVLYTGGRPYSA